MSFEVMKAPVISTAHISAEDEKLISKALKDRDLVGMQRDEGWLIHIESNIESDLIKFELGTLADVLVHFSEGDHKDAFEWVLFDCDADVVPELPTYNWCAIAS